MSGADYFDAGGALFKALSRVKVRYTGQFVVIPVDLSKDDVLRTRLMNWGEAITGKASLLRAKRLARGYRRYVRRMKAAERRKR